MESLVVQLNIVNGSSTEEGPFTRLHTFRDDKGSGHLMLVVDATGPDPQEVCTWAANELVEEFAQSALSLTGRLQEAMRRVHAALQEENRTSLAEHRHTLSVACGYVRGEDLYFTDTGNMSAFAIGPDSLHQLSPPSDEAQPPLGSLQRTQLRVRHHQLEPGDSILFAGPALSAHANAADVLSEFQRHINAGMISVYRNMREEPAFGALVLCPNASPDLAAETHRGTATDDVASYSYRQPAAGSSAPGSPQPTSRGAIPTDLTFPGDPSPSIGPPPPRPRSRRSRKKIPPYAWVAVVLLFILGGLFFGGQALVRNVEQQVENQVATLLAEARSLQSQAGAEAGVDQQRQLLTQAMKHLQDAQQLDPKNTDIAPLVSQLADSLRALEAVHQLSNIQTLANFANIAEGPTLIRNLVSREDVLYLLDKSGDRVFRIALANQQGDGVGLQIRVLPQSSDNQRNLDGLLWLPAGGAWTEDALLAIDDTRKLYWITLDEEPKEIPLRGAAEWESFQAAAGYNGSLYILDPQASQVWRYAPTDTGFDSERQAALPSLDLREAVDFMIDSNVYVLLRTGQVLKITGGKSQPFTLEGLDKPMINPTTLAGGGPNQDIYVYDAGNKRLVVFNQDNGAFLRQYPLPDLPIVQGIMVDQPRGRLLLATDTKLYAATLAQ